MDDQTTQTTPNSDPAQRVAAGMDRLAKRAHSGIDAASAAAGPAIERMSSRAHRAVSNADEVATQATEALQAIGVKGDELIATGTSYMRTHPILTLSLAVAAGYVLSRLLAPRRSSPADQ